MSLSAYSYVMNTFVITVNSLLTESPVHPMHTYMHVLSMHSVREYEKIWIAQKEILHCFYLLKRLHYLRIIGKQMN